MVKWPAWIRNVVAGKEAPAAPLPVEKPAPPISLPIPRQVTVVTSAADVEEPKAALPTAHPGKAAMARANVEKAEAWDQEWRRATVWRARPSPEVFGFEYLHKDGIVTDETVVLREILQSGPFHYLKGDTHPEGRGRNIQLDRVRRAWNVLSGHPIPQPADYFANVLPVERSSAPAHQAAMTRALPGLSVLLWIAGANPPLTDEARGVLLGYAAARQGLGRNRSTGVGLDLERAAKELVFLSTSRSAALTAVARIASKAAEAALLKDFTAQLVVLSGEGAARRAREALAAPAGG